MIMIRNLKSDTEKLTVTAQVLEILIIDWAMTKERLSQIIMKMAENMLQIMEPEIEKQQVIITLGLET